VAIAAVTPENKVLLISQFRLPVGKVCVEIPAGLVGDADAHAGEEWKSAALRELREETGYTADGIDLLTEGPTSAGLTSECIILARATGLKKAGDPTPDGDERITVHEVPVAEVDTFLQARARAGDLIDPKVYAALYFLTRR
jgi:ADP-ribose pyrophosphatase